MSKTMLLKPRVSEKAYGVSQALNTYVFDVPMTANKVTIAKAIASQFGVTIESVKIAIVKGKPKKSYQKRNRPTEGRRADSKKAYVRLKDGDSINVFGEPESEAKEAKKAKKSVEKKGDQIDGN